MMKELKENGTLRRVSELITCGGKSILDRSPVVGAAGRTER